MRMLSLPLYRKADLWGLAPITTICRRCCQMETRGCNS